jgi:hypothetical protein
MCFKDTMPCSFRGIYCPSHLDKCEKLNSHTAVLYGETPSPSFLLSSTVPVTHLFYPEHRVSRFPKNTVKFPPNYVTSYYRHQQYNFMINPPQQHTYHTPKQHLADSAECWPNTSKVSPYNIEK